MNDISILSDPYGPMISTINSKAIPVTYKAGRIDDIKTEEQFTDFIVKAMFNNIIDTNGNSISQNQDYVNNRHTMEFTGIQLVGLVSFISTIIIAVLGIVLLIVSK